MKYEDYEEQEEASPYFTAEEVNTIKTLAHHPIEQVLYHYWVNNSKNDSFKVLDYIQLVKDDKSSIFITISEETDNLGVSDAFDVEKMKQHLLEEFKGDIVWEIKDVSHTKIWKPNIGKAITLSLLRNESNTLNDSIGLKFEGADDLEIYPSVLDGLEVDYLGE